MNPGSSCRGALRALRFLESDGLHRSPDFGPAGLRPPRGFGPQAGAQSAPLPSALVPAPGGPGSDARGITTTYSYDALDRLTSKSYSNGDTTVNYYYDQTSYNRPTITNGKGPRTNMRIFRGTRSHRMDDTGGDGGDAGDGDQGGPGENPTACLNCDMCKTKCYLLHDAGLATCATAYALCDAAAELAGLDGPGLLACHLLYDKCKSNVQKGFDSCMALCNSSADCIACEAG
jgi:YD repeat-containing protein